MTAANWTTRRVATVTAATLTLAASLTAARLLSAINDALETTRPMRWGK